MALRITRPDDGPWIEVRPQLHGERRVAGHLQIVERTDDRIIVFTRYDVEKAVVLSPHDFHRLSALDEDLDELATDRIEPSELALHAERRVLDAGDGEGRAAQIEPPLVGLRELLEGGEVVHQQPGAW